MDDLSRNNVSEEEYEVEAIGVEVSCQPIELYKVLKIANAVSGGGEAKMAITEGYVGVNGDVETRKRCKVYDGDVIQFNGEFYLVLCDQPIDETPREKKAAPASQPAANKSAPKPAMKKSKNASSNQASSKKVQAKGQTAKAKKNGKAKGDPQPEQIDIQTGRRQIKF